jgi:cytoskeletal protein CcmA (bactofilin family)
MSEDLTDIGELQALLGEGAEFEGTLVFDGRVRIDGKLEGEVKSDGVLILGRAALLRGKVEVGTLIVRGGVVWGDVHAKRLVELYAPGQVHGTIVAPQMYLEKGATLDGRCLMPEPERTGSEPPVAVDEPTAPPEPNERT